MNGGMAMDEMPARLLAPFAGAALGFVFFGGLWWTVRRAATFRHPGLAVLFSLLLRTGAAMAGFYLVGAGHWDRLVLCLLGFLLARGVVTYRVRRMSNQRTRAEPGIRHAP